MLMLSQYFAENSKMNHFKSLFRALKMERYCNKNISTNFFTLQANSAQPVWRMKNVGFFSIWDNQQLS